jgi:hypothetical protein
MFRRYSLLFLFAIISMTFAHAADFPPGPMQEKVKTTCTTCHAAAQVTKQHKTKAEWSKVLDKMIGYGADVSETERPAVLKYLAVNFGPSKGPAKAAKTEDAPKAETPKAETPKAEENPK